jgi:F-type H+-transporting ATPase subunit gamma
MRPSPAAALARTPLKRRQGSAQASHRVANARSRQGGGTTIEQYRLLPLDIAPLAAKRPLQPRLHKLAPDLLLEKLVAEYVFALLTESAVESIASGNAARFEAMASAHDNVSKKLDQLNQAARQARQSEITMELLDLVTGAEALRSE